MNNDNIVLTSNQALKLVHAAMKLGEVKSIPVKTGMTLFFRIKKTEGVREATINYYHTLFKCILRHFEELGISETSQIDNKAVYTYVSYLMDKGLSNSSINKYFGAVKHLFNKLSEHDHIDYVKFSFKKLKEEVKEVKTLDLKQIANIVEYSKQLPLTNQIAIRMFIESGVRRTELINIKIENIDFKNQNILLTHTKNHENRYMFLSDETVELIRKLLKTYPENTTYLFSNPRSFEKMTTMFVDTIFNNMKRELGFQKIGAHLLRHTFCTAMARTNIDYKSLQKLMGHKTMHMTLRYIEVVNKDVLSDVSLANNPLQQVECG